MLCDPRRARDRQDYRAAGTRRAGSRGLSRAEPLVIEADARSRRIRRRAFDRSGTDVALVDDVDAELAFARACAPLFTLEWEEFARDQLDPEVPGLRTPERFLAIRLSIDPAIAGCRRIAGGAFFRSALHGATEFYANPPNFADPELLAATKSSYHDSLDVTPDELARQTGCASSTSPRSWRSSTKRTLILWNATGHMTGRDAMIAATQLLAAGRAAGQAFARASSRRLRRRAQDLTNGRSSSSSLQSLASGCRA